MTDIYESNGYLPVQYLVNAIPEPDNAGVCEDQEAGNIIVSLKFYKSKIYQTAHQVSVGHWKPCSNVHS
jgi:hypothetical protein